MSFRIQVFRTATREVDQILDWLIRVQKAPAGARAWFRAYEEAIARLRSTADREPLAPEDGLADFEIRQLLFRTRRSRQYYRLLLRSSATRSVCCLSEDRARISSRRKD